MYNGYNLEELGVNQYTAVGWDVYATNFLLSNDIFPPKENYTEVEMQSIIAISNNTKVKPIVPLKKSRKQTINLIRVFFAIVIFWAITLSSFVPFSENKALLVTAAFQIVINIAITYMILRSFRNK